MVVDLRFRHTEVRDQSMHVQLTTEPRFERLVLEVQVHRPMAKVDYRENRELCHRRKTNIPEIPHSFKWLHTRFHRRTARNALWLATTNLVLATVDEVWSRQEPTWNLDKVGARAYANVLK